METHREREREREKERERVGERADGDTSVRSWHEKIA